MPELSLLGDINAEKDHLLFKCAIQNFSDFENKHILTGRWGVGKSAILILKNREFVEIFENSTQHKAASLRLCWYAGEDSLDYDILKLIEDQFKETRIDYLISAFEKLWILEILRTYCITLGKLNKLHYYFVEEHWLEIERLSENAQFKTTNIWKNISLINNVLDIYISEISHSVSAKKNDSEAIFNEGKLFSLIEKCLHDIAQKRLNKDDPSLIQSSNFNSIPIIALEPIETYNSKIETDNSLAQTLIDALLSVYHKRFTPSEFSNFDVRLSIPWHRMAKADGKFIHKLLDYVGIVKWSKKRLKEFINLRIQHAFKKAGVNFNPQKNEAWYELFEKHIPYNPITSNQDIITNEDSFDYFIRHTHYRPRDILQLVKFCISAFIEDNEYITSEIHVFQSGKKIPAQLIKDTFRDRGGELGHHLIREGKRKYKYLDTIIASLNGSRTPCSISDLKKNFNKLSIPFETIIQVLWDCGILGIVVNTSNEYVKKLLEAKYTSQLSVIYIEAKQSRWFWFQHLCKEDNINQIKNHLEVISNEVRSFEWNFIIHPKMYEFMNIRPSDSVPMGI